MGPKENFWSVKFLFQKSWKQNNKTETKYKGLGQTLQLVGKQEKQQQTNQTNNKKSNENLETTKINTIKKFMKELKTGKKL